MGGIVLHEGDIAEMKTGEGKTFVASLALYLNALAGNGAHLVTVNDYLAKRDAEWNRGVYERLGMTVGWIESMMPFDERKAAYDCRHHLRDELRVRLRLPARQHGDRARAVRPARPPVRDRGRGRLDPRRRGADAADHLRRAGDRGAGSTTTSRASPSTLTRRPVEGHEARGRGAADASSTSSTTRSTRPSRRRESGDRRRSSARCGIDNLYAPENVQLVNHLNQALKAEALYQRDDEYVVQDGEVKIVDEFTGRIMEGRRWSEGLHQAVEAKEGVRDPGGARHARDDHAAELLPPLREARRHDRHGEDGGEGVRRDLRPQRRRDPDERAGRARRRERPDLQDDRGEVQGGRRRHQGALREGPAGADRHDRGRDVRVPVASCSRAPGSRTTS